MSINILGIRFNAVTESQTIEKIKNQVKNPKGQLFIATPNPEMVLESQKNKDLFEVLKKTDLNIPDGVGILWAAQYLQQPQLPKRVTGTDLMESICAQLPPATRIFLLGAAPGVAQKAKKVLEKRYDCTIIGTDAGSAHPENYFQLRETINAAKPDILFVAFGTPKQEIWLDRNLSHLKTVKVAIGVGGAFDFISGVTKRAPKFMQKLGLEWLWRLLRQPSRAIRIFNATVRFPLQVIRHGKKN